MTRRCTILARALGWAGAWAIGAGACAGIAAQWTDPAGDAVARPTDDSAPALAMLTMPDLLSVTLRGWKPDEGSPYTGRLVGPGGSAPTLRLDVVFAGVVNPPGEMGFFGPYGAYAYGPTPLFGFVEFDIDQDADTGGELPGSAELRYLANVGRFGCMPADGSASRTARSATDLDGIAEVPPVYERSGSDFALVLCGCHPSEIVQSQGNDLVFSAGETWVVRGRFFQRAGGYSPVSAVVGGSSFGTYDPMVDLRFSHDPATDTTTVTLVYPLDEWGASLLAGEPVQPLDQLIDFGSHSSVVEAVQDLVNAANQPGGGGGNPLAAAMVEGWAGRNPRDYLDPTQWTARAIVGTAYQAPSDGLYIWSDVGFGEVRGDVNGDGSADELDNSAIQGAIAAEDGGQMDADGVVDGAVQLFGFGYNFSVYDTSGDGVIDRWDLNVLRLTGCRADWNQDARVEVYDLLAFLASWFAQQGDLNLDGANDAFDLLIYLDAYFAGC